MSVLNIAIQIAGQDQGAGALLTRVSEGLGGLGNVAMGIASVGLAGVAAGVAGLGVGLGIALKEAMGAQEVMAQTRAVIESTGGAAGLTAEQIAAMATALSLQSRFSDDAIQTGQNLLLTFTNIGKDVFPGATQAMVDMAAAMGTDVKSGAIQLGKALNDPVAGISALSRVGVIFTEDQKKVVAALMEAGDVAGAQKLILAELAKEFGGSAAAAAETFAGKMDVMKNRLLNVAEAIGGPLLDVGMQLFDRFITPLIPAVEELGNGIAAFLGSVLGGGDLGAAFDALAGAVYRAFGPEAGLMVMQFGDFITGTFIPAVQAVVAWVVANWPQIQATIQQVGAVVIQLVQQAVDYFNAVLLPAFNAVVAWVVANWPQIQATIQQVITQVQQVITSVMTAVQAFWAANGEQIIAFTQTAFATIQTVIQTVLGAIQAFWEAHGASIMTIVTTFLNNARLSIENVLNVVRVVITTILEGIRVFWDAWGETIMTVVGNMATGIGAIFDAFAAAFRGDWEGFGNKLRELWDLMWVNILIIINTAIAQILEIDWAQLGRDLMQGVVNGINQGATWLRDAVLAAARAAWDAITGFFDNKSPSRKMMGLGVNLMQGLAIGIGAAAQLPARAAVGAGQGVMAGTAHSTVINNWTVNATYPYQSASSVGQELRLRTKLENR